MFAHICNIPKYDQIRCFQNASRLLHIVFAWVYSNKTILASLETTFTTKSACVPTDESAVKLKFEKKAIIMILLRIFNSQLYIHIEK